MNKKLKTTITLNGVECKASLISSYYQDGIDIGEEELTHCVEWDDYSEWWSVDEVNKLNPIQTDTLVKIIQYRQYVSDLLPYIVSNIATDLDVQEYVIWRMHWKRIMEMSEVYNVCYRTLLDNSLFEDDTTNIEERIKQFTIIPFDEYIVESNLGGLTNV